MVLCLCCYRVKLNALASVQYAAGVKQDDIGAVAGPSECVARVLSLLIVSVVRAALQLFYDCLDERFDKGRQSVTVKPTTTMTTRA